MGGFVRCASGTPVRPDPRLPREGSAAIGSARPWPPGRCRRSFPG